MCRYSLWCQVTSWRYNLSKALQQTFLLQSIVLAQAAYMINCRKLVDPSLSTGFFQNKVLFASLGILFFTTSASSLR